MHFDGPTTEITACMVKPACAKNFCTGKLVCDISRRLKIKLFIKES